MHVRMATLLWIALVNVFTIVTYLIVLPQCEL